jgi:hypothetical protein
MSLCELRLSLRVLRKQPVVTFTTLLALTVGIGMATTGFTLLDAVLFSRLPFPNGDRFVLVEAYKEPDVQRTGVEADRFRFWPITHRRSNIWAPFGESKPICSSDRTRSFRSPARW